MNKFDLELLHLGYDNYLKTSSSYSEYLLRNKHDFVCYISSARNLTEEGFIKSLSRNIFQNSIDVFDNIIKFELTDKGISYMQQHLEG